MEINECSRQEDSVGGVKVVSQLQVEFLARQDVNGWLKKHPDAFILGIEACKFFKECEQYGVMIVYK